MKTLQLTDEQALLILFSLRIYAIECDQQAGCLRNISDADDSSKQIYMQTIQRAQQARDLSTLVSRAQQHD